MWLCDKQNTPWEPPILGFERSKQVFLQIFHRISLFCPTQYQQIEYCWFFPIYTLEKFLFWMGRGLSMTHFTLVKWSYLRPSYVRSMPPSQLFAFATLRHVCRRHYYPKLQNVRYLF